MGLGENFWNNDCCTGNSNHRRLKYRRREVLQPTQTGRKSYVGIMNVKNVCLAKQTWGSSFIRVDGAQNLIMAEETTAFIYFGISYPDLNLNNGRNVPKT